MNFGFRFKNTISWVLISCLFNLSIASSVSFAGGPSPEEIAEEYRTSILVPYQTQLNQSFSIEDEIKRFREFHQNTSPEQLKMISSFFQRFGRALHSVSDRNQCSELTHLKQLQDDIEYHRAEGKVSTCTLAGIGFWSFVIWILVQATVWPSVADPLCDTLNAKCEGNDQAVNTWCDYLNGTMTLPPCDPTWEPQHKNNDIFACQRPDDLNGTDLYKPVYGIKVSKLGVEKCKILMGGGLVTFSVLSYGAIYGLVYYFYVHRPYSNGPGKVVTVKTSELNQAMDAIANQMGINREVFGQLMKEVIFNAQRILNGPRAIQLIGEENL